VTHVLTHRAVSPGALYSLKRKAEAVRIVNAFCHYQFSIHHKQSLAVNISFTSVRLFV